MVAVDTTCSGSGGAVVGGWVVGGWVVSAWVGRGMLSVGAGRGSWGAVASCTQSHTSREMAAMSMTIRAISTLRRPSPRFFRLDIWFPPENRFLLLS